MDIELIEQPMHFQLWGLSAEVEDRRYGEVGCQLMDQLWEIVRHSQLKTTGVNHWVYFAEERMFVGSEPRVENPNEPCPAQLSQLEFDLPRFARHLHVGPYHDLPQKWQALRAELASRGETITMPSLEVYGHCTGDEATAETTILLGLA